MAFSFRKMLSNINYFSKPGDTDYEEHASAVKTNDAARASVNIDFERTEPDSTSRQCATSLKLPASVKNFAAKKGSLSDTDILNINQETPATKKAKRKCKKLKLDIEPIKSNSDDLDNSEDETPSENTPKHVLLEYQASEKFKGFDFNKSFDIFDEISDDPDSPNDNIDIESLSDRSDSDGSVTSRERVKMCRKVIQNEEKQLVRALSLESFGDVELHKNEEERMSLLKNYHVKLQEIEYILKKLLSDFKFNIEVSKIFHCRSVVSALSDTNIKNIPRMIGEKAFVDNMSRGPSPLGQWNIVIENEDNDTKKKFKKQLLSLRKTIDNFLNANLNDFDMKPQKKIKLTLKKKQKSRITNKKRIKHFDFPDFRDAMMYLFSADCDSEACSTKVNVNEESKCICQCHSQVSETDSGLTSKTNDRSLSNQSITSSIGNFSLDSSTLTAYSESLDQIISYNSFQDTSLYSTLLQKPAIERITFYIQVHSIQLKCEISEQDYECKNTITFYCPTCKTTDHDENSVMKHILSQKHCEKIHFQYKTAYIKKCVAAGKEIQPSTVLNPMTMYRDDNKIVCFGDAMYACSLCFENQIAGESVLMAHCADLEHQDRRERLDEILE